jgi:hypothetical protein
MLCNRFSRQVLKQEWRLDQLIKGGQTAIDETNALVDSANAAAGKVGLNAAGKWFQEGVNTAQKIGGWHHWRTGQINPQIDEEDGSDCREDEAQCEH